MESSIFIRHFEQHIPSFNSYFLQFEQFRFRDFLFSDFCMINGFLQVQ